MKYYFRVTPRVQGVWKDVLHTCVSASQVCARLSRADGHVCVAQVILRSHLSDIILLTAEDDQTALITMKRSV